MQETMKFC